MEDSQKEFILLRIDALKELTEERFKSVAMALVLQAEDYKRRLETISVEVERLRKKSDETGGEKKGVDAAWGWIFGIVGIVVAIAAMFLHKG